MARESNWEVWTCDRCNHTIRRKEDQEPPEGWSQLWLPDGAGTAAVHMDLCDICAAECQDYLNRRDRFDEGVQAARTAVTEYVDLPGNDSIRYRTDIDEAMALVFRPEPVRRG